MNNKTIFNKISNDEETIDGIIESFEEEFPNENINELKFLKEIKEHRQYYYIFSLGEKLMVLTDDHTWHKIPTFLLSTKQKHNKEYDVKLLTNSVENITYELYPFEYQRVPVNFLVQENMIRIEGEECLLPKHDYFSKIKNQNATKYKWTDDLYLYVYSNNHKKDITTCYAIIKNDKIISGFEDFQNYFQEGDFLKNGYVTKNKKTLIIENNGDVQSIIIIRIDDNI